MSWCGAQTPSTSAKVVIWKHGRFQRRICAPSGRGWEEITTKPSKEHDPQDCTGSGTAPSPHRRFHMPRYSITKRHMEDGFPPLGFRIGGRLGWGCPEGENKAGGKGGEIFALVVIGGGGNLTSQGTDKSNLDSSRAYKIFTYFSILTVRNFLLYISA